MSRGAYATDGASRVAASSCCGAARVRCRHATHTMITTSTMMQSTPAAAPAAMRISGSREDVARTTHDECGTVVDSALLADNDVSMTEADDSAFSNVDVVAITGVGETTAAGTGVGNGVVTTAGDIGAGIIVAVDVGDGICCGSGVDDGVRFGVAVDIIVSAKDVITGLVNLGGRFTVLVVGGNVVIAHALAVAPLASHSHTPQLGDAAISRQLPRDPVV
jgi:hypothetical protein